MHNSLNEKGFTLVEALMAILIMSIGVLVVGTMQLTSIKTNASAGARSEGHAVVLSIVETLQQIPFDASPILDDGTHGIRTADLAVDGIFTQLGTMYTVVDEAGHLVEDGQGRRYKVEWTATQTAAIIGNIDSKTKTIILSVSWDTQTGSGSSNITTVKYQNIDLDT